MIDWYVSSTLVITTRITTRRNICGKSLASVCHDFFWDLICVSIITEIKELGELEIALIVHK